MKDLEQAIDSGKLQAIVREKTLILAKLYYAFLFNEPEIRAYPMDMRETMSAPFEKLLAKLPAEFFYAREQLDAQNSRDVLALLKAGKITVQEAKDLMDIMVSKTNVEMAEAELSLDDGGPRNG